MLDEEAINPSDPLRLPAPHILYNHPLPAGPLTKPPTAAAPPPLFPRSNPPPTAPNAEEISISRFVPQLRSLLDAHIAGTLDPASFPYANPADAPVQPDPGAGASAGSLRSA